MAVLRRLMLVALCAGLLSGIFATAAHQIATVPVILKAETYEKAAEHATAEVHHHTAAWEPESEAERAVYTLLADGLDRDRVCSVACCGAHAARRRGHLARRAFLGPRRVCDLYHRAGPGPASGGSRNRSRPAT